MKGVQYNVCYDFFFFTDIFVFLIMTFRLLSNECIIIIRSVDKNIKHKCKFLHSILQNGLATRAFSYLVTE